MTTFSQLPATMNLRFVRGDTATFDVDFDTALTDYAVSARIISKSGTPVATISSTVASGPGGVVSLSLTAEQTAALAAGDYLWELTWQSPSGTVRKALSGFVSVVER